MLNQRTEIDEIPTTKGLAQIEDASHLKSPGHPWMSCSREPLRVMAEVTEWRLYHGTRAELTGTVDAATWGTEPADAEGPPESYSVEPTGPIEDDPDLTNRKFRGNPPKSFRSREPLRITAKITDWQGHTRLKRSKP